MIIIIDNVLDKDECNNLVNIYANNSHKAQPFNDCMTIGLNAIEHNQAYVKDKAMRIEQIAKRYYGNHVIDWAEIFMRPPNTWQPYHYDIASDKTSLTTVTYLTDAYEGGYTQCMDGTMVKPKIGRTILFDGKKYEHGVSPVLGGYRYTMPIWYKLAFF